LTVLPVNQPPSFALSTNLLLVSEEAPLTTNYFFLTNLLAGPPNQSSETWGFVTTTVTNSGGTANGGVNAFTNTFQIGVMQTNHAPVIASVANQMIFENTETNTVTI